jgi:hypothetical protein
LLEAVANALERFEVEIRATVHEALMAGAAIGAYGRGRSGGGLVSCLFKKRNLIARWRFAHVGGVRTTTAKGTALQGFGRCCR